MNTYRTDPTPDRPGLLTGILAICEREPARWLARAHHSEPCAGGRDDVYLIEDDVPDRFEPELGQLLLSVTEREAYPDAGASRHALHGDEPRPTPATVRALAWGRQADIVGVRLQLHPNLPRAGTTVALECVEIDGDRGVWRCIEAHPLTALRAHVCADFIT